MLLVGPGGQNAKVWSDAGGSLDIAAVNVVLDDEAAAQLPDSAQITTGSWRPADYEPTTDIFPAPAPVPSGNVNLSVFDGLSANGTWNLYLVDDAAADMGSITSWSLNITTSGGPRHHRRHRRHRHLPPPPPPGQWLIRAPMPDDVYGPATTSNGTYAYAAGGYSFTAPSYTNALYRFDPVANTWSTLAPMTDAITMASAVYYPTTNKIYVFGGWDGVGTVRDRRGSTTSRPTPGRPVPRCRRRASRWRPATTRATARSTSSAATARATSTRPRTTVWEFDPVADTLTPKAPIPHGVGGTGFGIVGGHIYVAGGRDVTCNTAARPPTTTTSRPTPGRRGQNMPSRTTCLAAASAARPGVHVRAAATRSARLAGTRNAQPAGRRGDAQLRARHEWANEPTLNGSAPSRRHHGRGNTLVAAGGYTGATTTNRRRRWQSAADRRHHRHHRRHRHRHHLRLRHRHHPAAGQLASRPPLSAHERPLRLRRSGRADCT